MLDKARVYPEFQSKDGHYHIDGFHNPYLAKLIVKLTPTLANKSN